MSNMLEHFHKSDKIPPQCICNDMFLSPHLWGREVFAFHLPNEKKLESVDKFTDYRRDKNSQDIFVETVKLLQFKAGKNCSLHNHIEKAEFFLVTRGRFFVEILDLSTQIHHSFYLNVGDRIFIPRGLFHRMTCEKDYGDGEILEISTLDEPSDSYRLIKSV